MLLMWDSNDNELLRTPRLLTLGEGETEELSMIGEQLSTLERVGLVLTSNNSVLSLLSCRKL